MALRLKELTRAHRPLLRDFQNQHASLVAHLQRYALRHREKDLLSKTFVALDDTADERRIAGYFSLATASVERRSVGRVSGLASLPQFPIPAVLLAQLAVDQRVQGQGLGRYLFEEVLGRTLGLAQTGVVGFRVLVTDALDASAARFYARFGLAPLTDEYPCRMVLDLQPLLKAARTR